MGRGPNPAPVTLRFETAEHHSAGAKVLIPTVIYLVNSFTWAVSNLTPGPMVVEMATPLR